MNNMFSRSYIKIMSLFTQGGKTNFYNTGVKDQGRNEITFAVNLAKLSSYLMNAYQFVGLPESIDQNLMWSMLSTYGSLVVTYDSEFGVFRTLPYARNDHSPKTYNSMFNPTRVRAVDLNGRYLDVITEGILTEKEIKKKNVYLGSIFYLSNTSRFIVDFQTIIQFYADKISDIDRAMDIRRNYHKAPMMFTGEEKDKATFEKFFSNIEDNHTFFVNTKLFMDGVGIHPMESPYINHQLMGERNSYINDFLIQIGVTVNKQEDKTERVNKSEVEVSNEQAEINRNNILNALNDSCDKFNKKFGFDVYAEYIGDQNRHDLIMEYLGEEEIVDETNL